MLSEIDDFSAANNSSNNLNDIDSSQSLFEVAEEGALEELTPRRNSIYLGNRSSDDPVALCSFDKTTNYRRCTTSSETHQQCQQHSIQADEKLVDDAIQIQLHAIESQLQLHYTIQND